MASVVWHGTVSALGRYMMTKRIRTKEILDHLAPLVGEGKLTASDFRRIRLALLAWALS